jgi:hypothetical protein
VGQRLCDHGELHNQSNDDPRGHNARQTQLQLVSPTNQTIRNSQFLADGTVDPNRMKTTAAGFGAVTGAQPLRTIQAQLRFSF